MRAPSTPSDESTRLAAVLQTRALDTPPEECFDQLTALAARLCGAPTVLITLVDSHRSWIKSCYGGERGEAPREASFCAHTILGDDLLVIEDASLDARFAQNPMVVGEPGIRFYAGCPLVTGDGHAIGSLCVIDYEPRSLSPVQAQVLRTLGRHTAAMLQMRRAQALLDEHARAWQRSLERSDGDGQRGELVTMRRFLRQMVDERERAELELRRLERQLREIDAQVSPHTTEDLASCLEGPLRTILEETNALRNGLESGDPRAERLDRIYAATELAQTMLVLALAAKGEGTDLGRVVGG